MYLSLHYFLLAASAEAALLLPAQPAMIASMNKTAKIKTFFSLIKALPFSIKIRAETFVSALIMSALCFYV
jgi:hypothetical protein